MYLFFGLLLPHLADALTPADIGAWMSTAPTPPHGQFFHEYGPLSEEFHAHLLTWSNQQLRRSAKSVSTLHQKDSCTEGALFKSMNPDSVAPKGSQDEQRFIESLFLIESSYCLPGISVERAHSVFMSKEFRLNVMPQVVGFTQQGNTSCVESSGVTGILLPSKYCTFNRTKRDDNTVVVYTSLSSAYTDSAHQPLYFREEVIVFSQLSSGVAVYRATFSRSQDLGTTTKYLLRNTVSSSQRNIRDGYYEWLTKSE